MSLGDARLKFRPWQCLSLLKLSVVPRTLIVHSMELRTIHSTSFKVHYSLSSNYLTLYASSWDKENIVKQTERKIKRHSLFNRLTPNDPYMGRTAPLTSKRCISYIYSTNIGTKYFKHALYSPFFSLQNAVCFIMLTCLVPVLFTFFI